MLFPLTTDMMEKMAVSTPISGNCFHPHEKRGWRWNLFWVVPSRQDSPGISILEGMQPTLAVSAPICAWRSRAGLCGALYGGIRSALMLASSLVLTKKLLAASMLQLAWLG